MANQTVVSAAAIWQALFDTLTGNTNQMDFTQSGSCFFVDGNAGLDTNDGLSWDTAFVTLNRAIRASNADIAARPKGWASRNKIYVKGDKITEDLTVAPSKCDVIGVGTCDAENKTHICGCHTFTQSGTIMSMGWYNLTFSNDASTAIMTVADCAGLYFGNCDFVARADSIHAIHITGTNGHDLKIDNCNIINDESNDPFDTAGILIATTTTFWNLEIKNSYIEGDIGLKIDTTNLYNGRLDNCVLKAVTLPLDDDSDDLVWTNNKFISAADATTPDNVVDANVGLGAGNYLTDGTVGTILYPVQA